MCSFYPTPNFSLFSYEEVFKLPTVYPLYSIILTFNVLKAILKHAILKHANMLKQLCFRSKESMQTARNIKSDCGSIFLFMFNYCEMTTLQVLKLSSEVGKLGIFW